MLNKAFEFCKYIHEQNIKPELMRPLASSNFEQAILNEDVDQKNYFISYIESFESKE